MLITGGSRGIGAATAVMAAQRGYDVAISYVRNSLAAASVVSACEAAGASALAIAADVAVESDVIELFDRTTDQLGPIGAFVNNAGTLHPASRLDEFELERLQDVVAVNVVGAIVAAREAVRRMSTRHRGAGGAIVNVSSAASYLGSPNEFIDYAATKGAVDSMTIGLAKEVATEGIRVNAVRPGLIHTDIHDLSGVENRIARLAPGVPMQRGGEADEVAEVILWLASDAASYVTGALDQLLGWSLTTSNQAVGWSNRSSCSQVTATSLTVFHTSRPRLPGLRTCTVSGRKDRAAPSGSCNVMLPSASTRATLPTNQRPLWWRRNRIGSERWRPTAVRVRSGISALVRC